MISHIGSLLTSGDIAELFAGLLLLAGGAVFAVCAVALSFIDVDQHRLPNRILYPWAGISAVIVVLVSFLLTDLGALVRAVVAGLAWGGALLVIRWIAPGSMGLGDAKLAVILGLYTGFLGWDTVLVGVAGSSLLGGVAALFMLLSRRAQGRTPIAFGPHLLLGAALALAIS